jgi:hypothetical protein
LLQFDPHPFFVTVHAISRMNLLPILGLFQKTCDWYLLPVNESCLTFSFFFFTRLFTDNRDGVINLRTWPVDVSRLTNVAYVYFRCSPAERDLCRVHPSRDRSQHETTNAKINDQPTAVTSRDRLHNLPFVVLDKEIETSRIVSALRPLNVTSEASTDDQCSEHTQCTTSALSSCQSCPVLSSQTVGGTSGMLSEAWTGPLSARKMESLIFNAPSLSSTHVTSPACSARTSHCHPFASLNSVPQSSLPHVAPSVVLLTMPFLNSSAGSVIPNFQTAVTSSSMLATVSGVGSSNVTVIKKDDAALLLSGSMLPSVLPLRLPAPASNYACNVPVSDSSRKRLLNSLAESCFHPPEAKRMLFSAPSLSGHNTTSRGVDSKLSLAGGSVGALSTRLVPISSGNPTSVVNGHQNASQHLPRLAGEAIQTAASCVPAPTTLFSIPVQGLSGRGACPFVFMLPQAMPGSDMTLSRPKTASKFICLVNPPRPSTSLAPSSVPVSVIENVVAKSELFLPASVVSPHVNGTRLSGLVNSVLPVSSVVTSNNVHIVRPASNSLPLSKRQEPLYVVSLPSAAPVVRQLLEKSNAVSSPAWTVRLTSSSDVKTESPMTASAPPISILRFTPKSNSLSSSLAGIRFIPNLPASSCQVPALVDRRFLNSSVTSMAATSSVHRPAFLSFIQNTSAVSSSSFQSGTRAVVSSIQSTALKTVAALPSFASHMTAVLPKPLPGCAAAGGGILRTLLSRNAMMSSSLISSPAESISRSLSHLYTLNASKNSPSSVRLLSTGVVCRAPGNTNASERSENKCGKCGAPCLLTDSKLCITCLIMA